MAKRPTVPKFGTWDKDNVGYTVYFEKVRENKGATAPPLQHRPYNPNDPEDDGPMRAVHPPSSRPSTAGGRPNGQTHNHHHRRAGSTSSEPGGWGAEQSKFAPPPQYYPRASPQQAPQHQHHGGGGHRHHHPSPAGYGGDGHHGPQTPPSRGQQHQQQQRHHAAAAPAPHARFSNSPQNNVPNRQRPSAAVPKFGVWDEQSAASAAQGFTVQFERVKRDREVARAGGVPEVPRPPPPPPRSSHRDPFFSKMFGCFRPHDVRD